jgi:hypothetical protein
MEHFYQNIQGWFTFPHLYSYIVNNAPQNSHFVEVGVWKGTSAAFMGVEIINSGKNIKFDCIDPFIAVGDEIPEHKITHEDLKNEFINNMKSLEGHYTLYTLPSPEVTNLYEDKSLDFVFIDGSHKYEDVVRDIKAWLPKIKPGGILSGHDYHHTWPDVVKAVGDVLGEGNWGDPWNNCCWIVEV